MFDLRYHVASLAAVFIALAVGIVIGVAIASGGGVEKTTLAAREDRIRDLEAELQQAEESIGNVEQRDRAVRELIEGAYPALLEGRLEDEQIGLVFLGPIDPAVRSAVERTLTDSDAGPPARVTALELPLDASALEALIEDDPALAAFGAEGGFEGLGRGLGRELASGGVTPVWEAVDELLVEESVGSLSQALDGVVVVRSWLPSEEPTSEADQQSAEASSALVDGILQGIEDVDVRVIGVERETEEPSNVPFFGDRGISTVDNLDQLPGRVALALLLAGGDPGHYGTKEDADAIAPPIEPVSAETVGEES
jgi:Copper transport outer membrane protein, MctB